MGWTTLIVISLSCDGLFPVDSVSYIIKVSVSLEQGNASSCLCNAMAGGSDYTNLKSSWEDLAFNPELSSLGLHPQQTHFYLPIYCSSIDRTPAEILIKLWMAPSHMQLNVICSILSVLINCWPTLNPILQVSVEPGNVLFVSAMASRRTKLS